MALYNISCPSDKCYTRTMCGSHKNNVYRHPPYTFNFTDVSQKKGNLLLLLVTASDLTPGTPNVVVEWLTLLFRIRVQISVPATGYPEGFSWFFSVPPGECQPNTLKLGHDRFLPNPFQSNIIFTYYPITDSILKKRRKINYQPTPGSCTKRRCLYAMRRVSQSDFPKTIRLLPERISDRPVSPWCTV
jgi:hypothetical protein